LGFPFFTQGWPVKVRAFFCLFEEMCPLFSLVGTGSGVVLVFFFFLLLSFEGQVPPPPRSIAIVLSMLFHDAVVFFFSSFPSLSAVPFQYGTLFFFLNEPCFPLWCFCGLSNSVDFFSLDNAQTAWFSPPCFGHSGVCGVLPLLRPRSLS